MMRRHLSLLDYALGSLGRRRLRSASVTIALVFVSMLYASATFIVDALREEVRVATLAAPDLTLQRLVAGRPALIDEGAAAALENEPGVRSVRPRVWGFLFVEAIEANIVVIADPQLDAGPTGDDAVSAAPAHVGAALARRLALHDGDRLALQGAANESIALAIDEVASADSELHDADVLRVSDPVARRLLGVPEGQAVDVAIELVREEEADVIGARLQSQVLGARVIDRRAMARAYRLTFDGRGGLLNALFLPCLAILLLIFWERATGLGGDERKELVVLRAIGWTSNDVILARIYEGLLLAFLGVAFGILAAYAYVFWLGAPGLAGVLFGWSVLHTELRLAPASNLGSLLTVAALIIVPFVFVGVVPAWRAAHVALQDGLR